MMNADLVSASPRGDGPPSMEETTLGEMAQRLYDEALRNVCKEDGRNVSFAEDVLAEGGMGDVTNIPSHVHAGATTAIASDGATQRDFTSLQTSMEGSNQQMGAGGVGRLQQQSIQSSLSEIPSTTATTSIYPPTGSVTQATSTVSIRKLGPEAALYPHLVLTQYMDVGEAVKHVCFTIVDIMKDLLLLVLAWCVSGVNILRQVVHLLQRGDRTHVSSSSIDSWEKTQTGIGILLNFLLPVVKDVRSTNRSFEPRRIRRREARKSVGIRLGILPVDEEKDTVQVSGTTLRGQLTSLNEVLSSISVHATPAPSNTAVRPSTTEGVTSLHVSETQTAAAPLSTGVERVLEPCSEAHYSHIITTVPLVANPETECFIENQAAPDVSQLRVAEGVPPLKIKVPNNAELICINPNTVLHDPRVLAEDVARTNQLIDSALVETSAEPTSQAPLLPSHAPSLTPFRMAYFLPLAPKESAPVAPAMVAVGGDQATVVAADGSATTATVKKSFGARATRYALLLLAVADYLTPDKSIQTMTKIQNTCADIAQVLEMIPSLFDWTYPGATRGIVVGLILSLIFTIIVPQKYVLHTVGMMIMMLNTRLTRYVSDMVQGLASYMFNSLSRGERAAVIDKMWASTARGRADVLARYDVISDVVSNAELYKPQTSQQH